MLSQQPDQNEAAENDWDATLWQDHLPAARIATEGNASPQQVRSSEGDRGAAGRALASSLRNVWTAHTLNQIR